MCESNHHCNHKSETKRCSCRDQSLKLEGFLIPCLLLLLKEGPSHGYHLMERLSHLLFFSNVPDPAVVYRRLRCLEEDGFIKSKLEAGSGGPARKVYTLTEEGEAYLEGWVPVVRAQREALDGFLHMMEEVYSKKTSEDNNS